MKKIPPQPVVQIKFNLSSQLKQKLIDMANDEGITVTGFLKHLIIKEMSELRRIKATMIEKENRDQPPPDLIPEFYTEEL